MDWTLRPVKRLQVNGVLVKNLKEVVAAVEACHAPFLRMDLDYNQVPA